MKRHQIAFFVCGLVAGLLCVTLGASSIVMLAYGVGPLFFAAVVAGITITAAWRYVRVSSWRFFAGLLLCTITYVGALIAFSAVAGFSPDWFGIRPSAHLEDFGADIWLGFIAAGIVGASGIALFTALLTGAWSTSLLLRLMLAGLVTLVVTFITNVPFHTYWSFLGILLPIGSALFCWLVGTQIWLSREAASSGVATQTA